MEYLHSCLGDARYGRGYGLDGASRESSCRHCLDC